MKTSTYILTLILFLLPTLTLGAEKFYFQSFNAGTHGGMSCQVRDLPGAYRMLRFAEKPQFYVENRPVSLGKFVDWLTSLPDRKPGLSVVRDQRYVEPPILAAYFTQGYFHIKSLTKGKNGNWLAKLTETAPNEAITLDLTITPDMYLFFDTFSKSFDTEHTRDGMLQSIADSKKKWYINTLFDEQQRSLTDGEGNIQKIMFTLLEP